jgi:hypothetical protein
MTAARRPFRTQWIHHDEPKPEPVSARMQRAHKLPLLGPDLIVTIPLSLLPEYLELHGLSPMSIGEVADVVKASGRMRRPGVLYVKRIKKEENK